MSEWFALFYAKMVTNYALLHGLLMDCPAVDVLRMTALILFLVWMVKLSTHTLFYTRLRRTARRFDVKQNPELATLYQQVAQSVGLKRLPPLYHSPYAKVPAFAIGILRPAIFLHDNLIATLQEKELRCALTHEMVHIKRNDNLKLWLLDLSFTTTPLVMIQFFAVEFTCDPADVFIMVGLCLGAVLLARWPLTAQFRTLREHSCDDLTVRLTKAPVNLASSLIKTWRLITDAPLETNNNPMAWSSLLLVHDSCVERRVRRLLNYKTPRLKWWLGKLIKSTALASALTCGVFLWQFHVNKSYLNVEPYCQSTPVCSAASQCSDMVEESQF